MLRPACMTAVLLFATISSVFGGLTVDSVIPGGPAAAAGLRAGDRLISLADQKLSTMDDLEKVTRAHRPGDTVKIVVEREGQKVELPLTFGERRGGGVSIGVRLAITRDPSDGPHAGTAECLAWIEDTYRLEPLMDELDLDLSDDHRTMRACVEHDTQRMSSTNAVRYCDNIFKVHCAGLDLLTDIGEALVQRCEQRLGSSLGIDLREDDRWKICAQHKVFDGYSKAGETIDDEACKAALEECGAALPGA